MALVRTNRKRRARAVAAVAVLALTLGACGGGDDDTVADDTSEETTTTQAPPPTFAPDAEAGFLKASADPRAGKAGQQPDDVKLAIGRQVCADLKAGKTGKDVAEEVTEEDTSKSTQQELGFLVGTAVGAMCPDQQEQLKKGL
jgi:hypothetical protein